jgi:hypothetical protein
VKKFISRRPSDLDEVFWLMVSLTRPVRTRLGLGQRRIMQYQGD